MTGRPFAPLLASIAVTASLLAVAWSAGAAPAPSTPTPRSLLDQARAFRAQSKFAAQESVATAARAQIESSAHPDTVLLAEALHYIAHSRVSRQMFADSAGLQMEFKALELLRSVPNAPDTLVLTANRTIGMWLYESGRSHRALAHFRAARAVAERHPEWDKVAISVIVYNLASAQQRAGMNDSALVTFREALELRRHVQMPRDVLYGEIYGNMAMAYAAVGRDDLAEDAFQKGIRENEERLDREHPMLVGPLSRYAAFAFQRGDYARALDLNRRALHILEVREGVAREANRLIVRFSVAQAYEQVGDLARAQPEYLAVLPSLEALIGRTHPEIQTGWLSLAAVSQKLGDVAAARSSYAHIRQVFREDTTLTERENLAAALAGESQLLYAEGLSDTALVLALEAERVNGPGTASSLMPTLQALTVQMAVHADRGAWARVDTLDARLSRELARFAFQGNNQSDFIWITRSRIAEKRGRHGEAVAAAAEGARQARERLVRNVRALSDRQALLFSTAVSAPLDELLRVGSASDPASVRTSWDEVIRTRGLVRAEVARRRIPSEAARDSVQVLAHGEWVRAVQRLAQFEAQRASARRDRSTDSTRAALRTEVDESERRWARGLPAHALVDPTRVGIDSVLAHVGPEQALVGFAQAPRAEGRHLIAFVARHRSPPTTVDLGDVERLSAPIAAWIAALGEPRAARRSEADARRAGAVLRSRIWDPILKEAGGPRELILVPEAPVAGLPWGALPAGGGRYLVESGPIIHVVDAERAIAAPSARAPGRGLLAVGGVDYDRGAPAAGAPGTMVASIMRSGTGCDTMALRTLEPLPGTEKELRDIEATWTRAGAGEPVSILEGAAATEIAFKAMAPGKRALHVATHGIALSDTCAGSAGGGTRGVGGVAAVATSASGASSRRNAPSKRRARAPEATLPVASPWLGRQVFLALADANHARENSKDENEGLLTAEEVTTLDLSGVDWVVLSACQTATGESWAREGVLGMQRAFRLAGARTVIASQWSVSDEATRPWMRALYEAGNVRGAGDPVTSASRSVLQARRRAGESTHPFYWAAFTASGE